MRTTETIAINNALEVVRLTGKLKFRHPLGYTMPTGWCFKHPVKGYLAFEGNTDPYLPCGGKRALLSIMEQGGFLNFDNAVWVNPIG